MSKILLVEDDRELSAVVCNYLDSRNYSLEPAYDGLTAREFLGTYEYDLVILDWSLPEEDGLSLLKWLRSQEQERRSFTPVIGGGPCRGLFHNDTTPIASRTRETTSNCKSSIAFRRGQVLSASLTKKQEHQCKTLSE